MGTTVRICSLAVLVSLVGCLTNDNFDEFVDHDGDGHLPIEVGGDDCDNDDPAVHPDADEVCGDGIDNDCDGIIDDSGIGDIAWYYDGDNDGYGGTEVWACDAPDGYISQSGDCDDDRGDVYPTAADDQCDGVDNDCDALIDEDSVYVVWYQDDDNDGEGLAGTGQSECAMPTTGSWADNDDDCDDTNAAIFSTAPEVCDSIDNDCDTRIDDEDSGLVDAPWWYVDTDGDGVGTTESVLVVCVQPNGYVLLSDDCDDSDAANYPGNHEVCDDQDNDCDLLIDDADDDLDVSSAFPFYLDSDGDLYGVPGSVVMACVQPVGTSVVDTDCNDVDSTINPSAAEICDPDDIDENCNGVADDADKTVTDPDDWYADSDEDGFGDDGTIGLFGVITQCEQPIGFVLDNTDCNDDFFGMNPGEWEVCDDLDIDENCNYLADDDDPLVVVASFLNWYADTDGDEYGDPLNVLTQCNQPTGYTDNDSDCDDSSASVHPFATEVCDDDNADEDCDGVAEDADDSVDSTSWLPFFADIDGDGYGDADVIVWQCDASTGATSDDTDCDDADAASHPGSVEICGDGADNDCDTSTDCRLGPLLTSLDADGIVTGTVDMGHLGMLTHLGDFTGDGRDDWFVSAPDAPAIYQLDGVAADLDAVDGLAVWDDFDASFHGFVSPMVGGDITGNGVNELAVMMDTTSGLGTVGIHFRLAGPPLGNDDPGVLIFTNYPGFSGDLSLGGDLSGDGVGDLVLSNPSTGSIHIFTEFSQPPIVFGSNPDFEPELDVFDSQTTISASDGSLIGLSALSNRDMDSDGVEDLVFSEGLGVGLWGFSGGSLTTNMDIEDADWWTSLFLDLYSARLSSVGDINDDGFQDILIWREGVTETAWFSFETGVGFVEKGSFTHDAIDGGAVAGLGDIDSDGFDDFAITNGSAGAGGEVYVVYGQPFAPSAHLLADVAVVIEGADSGGGFGDAVSAIGDVNDDGYADFTVSAPYVGGVAGALEVGEVYLFLGLGL